MWPSPAMVSLTNHSTATCISQQYIWIPTITYTFSSKSSVTDTKRKLVSPDCYQSVKKQFRASSLTKRWGSCGAQHHKKGTRTVSFKYNSIALQNCGGRWKTLSCSWSPAASLPTPGVHSQARHFLFLPWESDPYTSIYFLNQYKKKVHEARAVRNRACRSCFQDKKKIIVWPFASFCFSPFLLMFGEPSCHSYCSQSHMLGAASKKSSCHWVGSSKTSKHQVGCVWALSQSHQALPNTLCISCSILYNKYRV